MIEPPPWRSMWGTANLAPRNTERTLTAITRSQSSTLSSTAVPGRSVPALLNSTSSRPNCSTVLATMASTEAASATSTSMATAWPPPSLMAATVSSALRRRTSATATAAPSAAKRIALAAPMPEPAPVTIAILFSSSMRTPEVWSRRR
jgi:hypothetical protein